MVVLTGGRFQCTGCNKWKDASDIGLRKMPDGVIRNQPQCHECRSLKEGAA